MKKKLLILSTALILAWILFGTIAAAVGPYPVTHDLWMDGSATTFNTNPLRATSSNVSGTCTQHNGTIYLQWTGLGTIGEAIGSATVSLTSGTISTGGSGTLTLYETSDDNMPPASLGSGLTDIALNLPISADTEVTFPTSANLVTYLNNARTGDGTATFAIRWSICPSNILQEFKDNSTAAPAQLSLFNATAITLSSLTAASTSTASLALFTTLIGLAALALVWIRRH